MKLKKPLLVALGIVFLVLGVIGLLLPIIPQIPFLAAAAILLSSGSKRVNRWVVSTKVYRKYLQSTVENSPFLSRLMHQEG